MKRIVAAVVGGVMVATSIITPVVARASAGQTTQQRVVTLYDRGQERTIITTATTVEQALAAAGLSVDPALDRTEPSLATKLEASSYHINIYRARPVTVVDDEWRVQITTAEQSPTAIARAAGLTLHAADTAQISSSLAVALDGGREVMTIQRATEAVVEREEAVDFPVEATRDAAKPLGQKTITTPGVPGKKLVTYKVQLRRGAEVDRQALHERVLVQPTPQQEVIGAKPTNPLTKSRGAHIFTDSRGVAHRETYYDLPMNVVMGACGAGGRYSVRADGAKIDKDGFVIVAAHLGNYPRCSVVETSMGPGKVYDTGGFAARHPHGFDLATDWTNGDGR
ncbi:MAG: G5 domain-containing protein [Candidatus Saccharibacteria bacterium]|nr:G5 domain-containing protein [Candidatus Saccharibacteria bacterium]